MERDLSLEPATVPVHTEYNEGHDFWGTQLIRSNELMHEWLLSDLCEQNWGEEVRSGKQHSKLEDQCNHRCSISKGDPFFEFSCAFENSTLKGPCKLILSSVGLKL